MTSVKVTKKLNARPVIYFLSNRMHFLDTFPWKERWFEVKPVYFIFKNRQSLATFLSGNVLFEANCLYDVQIECLALHVNFGDIIDKWTEPYATSSYLAPSKEPS